MEIKAGDFSGWTISVQKASDKEALFLFHLDAPEKVYASEEQPDVSAKTLLVANIPLPILQDFNFKILEQAEHSLEKKEQISAQVRLQWHTRIKFNLGDKAPDESMECGTVSHVQTLEPELDLASKLKQIEPRKFVSQAQETDTNHIREQFFIVAASKKNIPIVLLTLAALAYAVASPVIHNYGLVGLAPTTSIGLTLALSALALTITMLSAIAVLDKSKKAKLSANSALVFYISAGLLALNFLGYGIASPVIHGFGLGGLSASSSAAAMFGILAGAVLIAIAISSLVALSKSEDDREAQNAKLALLISGSLFGLGALAYTISSPVIHGYSIASSLSSGATSGIIAGIVTTGLAAIFLGRLFTVRRRRNGSTPNSSAASFEPSVNADVLAPRAKLDLAEPRLTTSQSHSSANDVLQPLHVRPSEKPRF